MYVHECARDGIGMVLAGRNRRSVANGSLVPRIPATIGGRHADVDVGEAARDRAEHVDEPREVGGQVGLLIGHRRRVVDQDQQIDVAVHGDRNVLDLDAVRRDAVHRIDRGDRG